MRNEKIFYDRIKLLLTNLLLKNPNYEGDYFHDRYYNKYSLLSDVKERAEYILSEIETTKHLINL
jgi:hypothetical protein